jgi:PhoPQ-activated pathogenicity-related protein
MMNFLLSTLARLPMVKSVVKAFDAIQEFIAALGGSVPVPQGYVVAGMSKRGW